jgi:tRNA A-37 threonylcarbamoyl transferase component Bud32
MYVFGVSYTLTLGLILYLMFWGPAQLDTDFVVAFTASGMEIRSVIPNTPVAKGGLLAGDRVVMIDDLPIANIRDWTAATGNSQAHRPQRWIVLRNGNRTALEIVPDGVSIRSKLEENYQGYLTILFSALFLGMLIGWKRPYDAIGRLGAWFMMTASITFGLPHGWAVPWRAFPTVLQGLLWIPQLSRFVLEGIFLSFFLVFPRPLVKRRWIWFLVWIPVLITLPWRVKAFYAVIHPGQVSPVPAWILTAGFVRTMLYMLCGIVVLAVSYLRLLDINEKRRVRVLIVGTVINIAAALVLVWFDTFSGRMSAWGVILYPVFFANVAWPFTMAYAILRHRVLDIAVIIRQGLQYAFARGGVIGFVPAIGVFFLLDLTLNSDQRVADVFRNRGWVYGAAAALSLVAYWKRREWLDSIDRRFFRERYNAHQLLRDVGGEIRGSADFAAAAARVIERIETSLHPEFASVLVRPPDEAVYRPVATFPEGHVPPHLTSESKVVALLHVLGKPLELLLGDSAWLDQRLPRDESEFVRSARIDLLVPVASGPAQTEALLALGVKRSEEPYTREDQQLLESIGASLALLLGRVVPSAERPTPTFQECPECGTCYASTSTRCPADNAALFPMRIPRTLAGRYTLDRRRGRGGMGTVYEATDSSLERRVAVKLIREDWTDSAEALQRFRREARASAGFAHPNVVTIYDYGVDSNTRAFLVMELLEGRSLRDELNQHRRLDAPRIVELFRSVCSAVAAAHERNLIHRDLKPENIFLARAGDKTDVLKVLDFGVAKFLPSRDDAAPTRVSSATQTGILVGTPAYMSPEQLLGEDLHVLWDLWAMTVTVYETLTGALPFSSQAGADSRRAVLSGTFAPLGKYLENPPAQWEAFFAQAFAANPEKRPQSAAEFFRLLQKCLLQSG